MSQPKRSREHPLGDALGSSTGPIIEELKIKDRVFKEIPVVWQDWTFHQIAATERKFGSANKFKSYWFSLDNEVDPESSPQEQAKSLSEKARELNQGLDRIQKKGASASSTDTVRLLRLGDADIPAEEQAFYLYVLLGPHEEGLSEEQILKGERGWELSVDWVMANLSPVDAQIILIQCLAVQYEALAGILEAAEEGEHPGKDLLSGESNGEDS
jgi:hypothetical protein